MNRIISLALVCTLVTGVSISANATEPKARIVLIAGQVSHPSGQHEFNAGSILLARALNEHSKLAVHVNVVHDGWPTDESVFEGAQSRRNLL